MATPKTKQTRDRAALPVLIILVVGLAASLTAGVGKPGWFPPVRTETALAASIDGSPVRIGGPGIALIQRQFAPDHAPRPAKPKNAHAR